LVNFLLKTPSHEQLKSHMQGVFIFNDQNHVISPYVAYGQSHLPDFLATYLLQGNSYNSRKTILHNTEKTIIVNLM
jgi:hypothetical protein